jgi:large subunit ribosomal protein L36e
LANVIEIIYNPIIFAAKLSILLLFLRVFVPSGKGATYYVIHTLIWLNLLFYIANVPIEIWPCIPRQKLWKPSIPGRCLNNERVFVAGGAINVVSDFAIMLLPVLLISRLQMPLKKKIGVSAIFATGFLQVLIRPCSRGEC